MYDFAKGIFFRKRHMTIKNIIVFNLSKYVNVEFLFSIIPIGLSNKEDLKGVMFYEEL